MEQTWVAQLASSLLAAYRGQVPDDVLERAAVQTFDAIACAAGAHDAEPVRIVRGVTAGSGPAEATVFFSGTKTSVLDAVLVNGTAVRYLDYNDAFVGSGPGGHPSDNIVVALAVGEAAGACGRDVLAAISLGYELFWRFRQNVYARASVGEPWDGVSVSGLVGAAMSGLLIGLDERQLAHALAIGGVKGYTLKQVRRGSISMVKGNANALVARDGILAAQLAAHGMTGPAELFEGKSGMMRALGVDATDEIRSVLFAAPEWAIRQISIKAYPSLSTSQAAVHAATLIARREGFDVGLVEKIMLRLPDSKATREHLGIEQRQRPDSRESADHSIPFLVACALTDGDLSPAQFENERWLQPPTLDLMAKVEVVPDAALVVSGQRCYPAVVTVTSSDGRTFTESVLATPGSPDAPWGMGEVMTKFGKVQGVGFSPAEIETVARLAEQLPKAADLSGLLTVVSDSNR